jgi:hypothetical protein
MTKLSKSRRRGRLSNPDWNKKTPTSERGKLRAKGKKA